MNTRGNPPGPDSPAAAFCSRAPRVGLRGRAVTPAEPAELLPVGWPQTDDATAPPSRRADARRAANTLTGLRSAIAKAKADCSVPRRVSEAPQAPVPGPGAAPQECGDAPWKIRGQSNPPELGDAPQTRDETSRDGASELGRAFRRELYRVRETSRRLTSNPNHRKCGHVRVGPQVAILRNAATGRCSFGGLATCGLVWECLPCSTKIRVERARELQQAVAWHCDSHGADSAQLLTLTVRHRYGDELFALRAGLANAWRRFTRDQRFKRFKARVGLVGYVRALEVTHGGSGWHPHLHIVLLVKHPAQLAIEHGWLAKKWQTAVVDELGAAAEPNVEHGVDVRACHKADYLAKLGLEIAAPRGKAARRGNRSPFEIVGDIDAPELVHEERSEEERAWQRAESIHLWRSWCEDMKGARMLTWSRGLRKAAGLGEELTDEELAAAREGDVEVVRLSAEQWEVVTPKQRPRLLEAAERGGRAAVLSLLQQRGPP